VDTVACFGPDPVPEPAEAPVAAFRVPREAELLTAGSGPCTVGFVLVVGFVAAVRVVEVAGFA